MGLFSRKEPSGSGRRGSARTSSEAQAAELRVRARRRLIGALVLVLTAVIFVPMLFDSPPEEEMPVPVVLPDTIPPIPAEPQVALAPESPSNSVETSSGVIQQPQPVEPAAPVAKPSEPTPQATATTPEPAPAPEPARKPEPPAEAPKPTPAKPPANDKPRTDDGSVALALLEGRKPVQQQGSAAPASGNFVLQVAAYTTEGDAQSRRDKLAAAGVTNAYVENAVANGKTAYRLRVGPFPTREAAEAAQARLRQLGYNNGLIFTK
ncbi:MAG TPA: SPOR domain-containing protein [Burkholderiaceae bacterium]|nr:SPOR domain-containing protein [Burkholderiaceae bacterium]